MFRETWQEILSAFFSSGTDIEFTDDNHDDDADDHSDFTAAGRAGSAGRQVEIMGEGGAEQEAEHGQGTVRIAFSRKHQLAQRAAAQQDAGETDEQHAEGVPESVHMGNRLPFESQGEIRSFRGGREDQVHDQRGNENGDKSEQQFELPEKNRITDAADHAQPGALGKPADNQAGQEADPDGRMLCPGTAACFREGGRAPQAE